jgi:hypothetical protein
VLPVAPLEQVLAATPPEPEWLWRGYVAPGSLTVLAGRPKVGKSTLLFSLLAAMRDGGTFLGQPVRPARALLLSEEREGTLADKTRRWGRMHHVAVALRHQALHLPWPEVVRQAVRAARDWGAELLIIDTFPEWAALPGDTENAAGAVLTALRPLQEAAGAGLAVVLVTHQRKAPGEHGAAVRGSTALAGAVDVVLELERPPGGALTDQAEARVLRAVSRYASTPQEVVVALAEDGFTVLGDTRAAVAAAERQRLLAAVQAQPGSTTDDLAEAAGMPRATAHKRLVELRNAGQVERAGDGRRGAPHTWWPTGDSFRHGIGCGRGEKNSPPPEAGTHQEDDSSLGRQAVDEFLPGGAIPPPLVAHRNSSRHASTLSRGEKNSPPPEAGALQENDSSPHGQAVANFSSREAGVHQEDDSSLGRQAVANFSPGAGPEGGQAGCRVCGAATPPGEDVCSHWCASALMYT